jgi:hypothetical protein
MNDGLPSLVFFGSVVPDASYDVAFNISPPVDKTILEKLESQIKVFAEAGEHGGFVVPSESSDNSRLVITSSDHSKANMISFKLLANFIDVRAFQLLRNIAGRFKLMNAHIRGITVTQLGQKDQPSIDLPVPSEENEEDIYPEASEFIGFDVVWEESDFGNARRCLVEMYNSVNSSHALSLAEWIEPWYRLLEAGAFAMPIGLPDETESTRGSVTIFDDITIEISIDRFQASESAWYVLVNLIYSFSKKSSAVAKVIID